MRATITLVITCDYQPLDGDDEREHVIAVKRAHKSIVYQAESLWRDFLADEARVAVSGGIEWDGDGDR